MNGAAQLGHPKAAVEEIFDQMAKFSGYGFNKSHSAAYALVAYQTAYLKTHYPVEFMAALLTSETSKPDNVVKYIGECKEMGIAVEPPDVQVSGAQFTPHGRSDSLRAGGGEECGRQRDRVDHQGARRSWRAIQELLGVLREGRSARDEQARDRVADQGGRAGFAGQARAAVWPRWTRRWSARRRRRRMRRRGRAGLFGLFDEAPAHGRNSR